MLGEVDRIGRLGTGLGRGELAEGTVWPGGVVVLKVFGQHLSQVVLVDDQRPVEEFPAQGPALGNTQLKVYHKLLSNPGMRYQDLGPDYYERQAATRRKIAYHVREIEALGLDVTLTRPAPEPGPDGPGNTQAA